MKGFPKEVWVYHDKVTYGPLESHKRLTLTKVSEKKTYTHLQENTSWLRRKKMDNPQFSIPDIPIWLDERQYILASDLIGEAAGLIGDGTESGLENNPEYTRGMAELIMRFMRWPPETVSSIIESIKVTATSMYTRLRSVDSSDNYSG